MVNNGEDLYGLQMTNLKNVGFKKKCANYDDAILTRPLNSLFDFVLGNSNFSHYYNVYNIPSP